MINVQICKNKYLCKVLKCSIQFIIYRKREERYKMIHLSSRTEKGKKSLLTFCICLLNSFP
jgi:hypothetical protein